MRSPTLALPLRPAQVSELAANPDRDATGTVIEAALDKTRGPVATLLVQAGTLRAGDIVVCGPAHGRVRALLSDSGKRLQEAAPSTPVLMMGLDTVPTAGDVFRVMRSETEAREAAEVVRASQLAQRLMEQSSGQAQRVSLASLGAAGGDDDEGLKRLNIILKADVSGSLEAVKAALGAIDQGRVALRFLLAAPGEVTASDVDLAVASDAIVLSFNVPCPEEVASKAKQKGVEIRPYNVIYAMVDEVKAAMEGMLKAVTEKVPIGEAEVRARAPDGGGMVTGLQTVRPPPPAPGSRRLRRWRRRQGCGRDRDDGQAGARGGNNAPKSARPCWRSLAACAATGRPRDLPEPAALARSHPATQATKCHLVVKRGKETVWEGTLVSLRRIKEIVKEVSAGLECGIGSEFAQWKEGDKVEAYELVTRRVTLPVASAAGNRE